MNVVVADLVLWRILLLQILFCDECCCCRPCSVTNVVAADLVLWWMLLLQTLFCDECCCCRPCSVTNVVAADLVLWRMLLLQTLFCDECCCCRPCSVTNVVVADLVLWRMLLLQTLFCDECCCCRPCSVTNVVVADLVLWQMLLLLTLFESVVTTTTNVACVADCLAQRCNSSRKDCCLHCFMPCLKVRRRWWRMLSALPMLVWRHGDYGEEHCLCCFRPCLKGWCQRWRTLSVLFQALFEGVVSMVKNTVLFQALFEGVVSTVKNTVLFQALFEGVVSTVKNTVLFQALFEGVVSTVKNTVCVVSGLVWRGGVDGGEWWKESSLHHPAGLHQGTDRGHTEAEECQVGLRTPGSGTRSHQVSLALLFALCCRCLWGRCPCLHEMKNSRQSGNCHDDVCVLGLRIFTCVLQGSKFPPVQWSATTKTASGLVEFSLPLVHRGSHFYEKRQAFFWPMPQR